MNADKPSQPDAALVLARVALSQNYEEKAIELLTPAIDTSTPDAGVLSLLARLKLDERGAWELQLDNGVTLRLGRQHIDQRFDRFMQAASRVVAARAAEIAYVDLRYSSGFAIGWRPGVGEVARG